MFFNTFYYFLPIILVIGVPQEALPMNTSSTEDFFPEIRGNLTKLTWAHAVNNQTLLREALNDTNVMMLEADIVLGTINGIGPTVPIMGHPPTNTSDLSLEQFLNSVEEFNNNRNGSKKGVKLDFKTIDVFNESVQLLTNISAKAQYPMWINADILPGPVNATTLPVNANQFLQQARNFPKSVLSIGWTTEFPITAYNVSYTDDQISTMVNSVRENNITQEITFPVRAALAAESLPQMQKLLSQVPNSTLTLWLSSESETLRVDVKHLRTLIATIGVDKIYIDVPKNLSDKLRLDQLNGTQVNPEKTSAAWQTKVTQAVLIMAVLLLLL